MFKKDSFETFKKNLIISNKDWNYFTGYEKVQNNLDKFKSLVLYIGKVNAHEFKIKFIEYTSENPDYIEATPLFSAVRDTEVVVLEAGVEKIFNFKNITPEESLVFLRKVGFFNIFQNGPIDLPSYFLGVEVGLDSNARKNRSGKLMESYVKKKLIESRWAEGNEWASQVKSNKIQNYFNISFIQNKEKRKNKQFDFVLVTKKHIYLIETNFFNSNGSKINSMLGRFQKMADDVNNDYKSTTHEIHFVWVTDGQHLKSDLGGFEDAYKKIEIILNIKNLDNNVFDFFE